MKLRELKLNDAEQMFEWMHDISIVEYMQTDFASKTIADCRNFIMNSISDESINLAIVDDNDEYMGTVSLKHINKKNAEFAIVVSKKAMGKGYAIFGMKEIIKIAFDKYGVDYVYWCVNKKNERAVKFYDKHGWKRVKKCEIDVPHCYSIEEANSYLWYKILLMENII